MKFPYSLSKRFLFPILFMQFLITQSVSSLNLTNEYLNHKCLNQGKYNYGSEYENNLNSIFHDFSTSEYAETGFVDASLGKTIADFVNVALQCRGDSYRSNCRTCVNTAISGVNELYI